MVSSINFTGIFKNEKKAIIKDLVDIMEKDIRHSSSYNEMFNCDDGKNGLSSNCKMESNFKNENKESMKFGSSKKKHKRNLMNNIVGIFKNEKKAIIKDLVDIMEKDISHSSPYNDNF